MKPSLLPSIAIAALAAVGWRPAPRAASHVVTHVVTHDVTIVARDYAFDAPDTVPAGVTTIHFTNHGSDVHHVALVRLDSGRTTLDFTTALAADGPLPTWATYLGGPNPSAPGTEATATLMLAPGHYLVTCLVHSPDSASRTMVSHVVKGMVRPLIVTGPSRPAPLPQADVTLTLVDYGFDLSHPLSAGKHVIRVRNTAAQPHELALVRLANGAPGKSMSDLLAWVHTQIGPLPATPVGGVTPLSRGAEANIAVNLEAGEYGLLCWVPDAGDGQPHVTHGMTREITVEGGVDGSANGFVVSHGR
jgi:plastocyanin